MGRTVTQSLDRFYPEDDDDLGVKATPMTKSMKDHHRKRYDKVVSMMVPHVAPNEIIMDVGCGSGYGTAAISEKFRYVIGVDPNEVAIRYARKHYPKLKFLYDMEGADVGVFVESIEFMSRAEFRLYLDGMVFVAVANVILKKPSEYHRQPFVHPDDVDLLLKKSGFKRLEGIIDPDFTFETGDSGDQYYGLYVNELTKDFHDKELQSV